MSAIHRSPRKAAASGRFHAQSRRKTHCSPRRSRADTWTGTRSCLARSSAPRASCGAPGRCRHRFPASGGLRGHRRSGRPQAAAALVAVRVAAGLAAEARVAGSAVATAGVGRGEATAGAARGEAGSAAGKAAERVAAWVARKAAVCWAACLRICGTLQTVSSRRPCTRCGSSSSPSHRRTSSLRTFWAIARDIWPVRRARCTRRASHPSVG